MLTCLTSGCIRRECLKQVTWQNGQITVIDLHHGKIGNWRSGAALAEVTRLEYVVQSEDLTIDSGVAVQKLIKMACHGQCQQCQRRYRAQSAVPNHVRRSSVAETVSVWNEQQRSRREPRAGFTSAESDLYTSLTIVTLDGAKQKIQNSFSVLAGRHCLVQSWSKTNQGLCFPILNSLVFSKRELRVRTYGMMKLSFKQSWKIQRNWVWYMSFFCIEKLNIQMRRGYKTQNLTKKIINE